MKKVKQILLIPKGYILKYRQYKQWYDGHNQLVLVTVFRRRESFVNITKFMWFRSLKSQWQLLLLSVPFMCMVLLFSYVPLWGWSYAFFEVSQQTMRPIYGTDTFLGISSFERIFAMRGFQEALRNSLVISVLRIITGYVGAISLAIMINELRIRWFKRTVQTISYLPHFISWVVATSMITVVLSPDGGAINNVLMALRIIDEPVNWMIQNNWRIWMVLVLAALWKEIGWNTIIYLAAMSGIDPELYEAAQIDGAGRIRRILYITLPSIAPLIRLLLILSFGGLLSVGFEQYLLMQRPITFEHSQVLETLVYNMIWGSANPGRMHRDIPVATAVGILNSLVAFTLLLSANKITSKITGERLF